MKNYSLALELRKKNVKKLENEINKVLLKKERFLNVAEIFYNFHKDTIFIDTILKIDNICIFYYFCVGIIKTNNFGRAISAIYHFDSAFLT